ncbi:MAG: DUF951 domain-containing protein [Clostridiales bacterium]|jgi:hypothetical protein|nr:DUF951 domain-containing protein [Clostridiales bacterium]
MKYEIGTVVRMKKPHPCGGFDWEVQRAGMDFRIRCVKCGHSLMLPRARFEKNVAKILCGPSPEKIEID